MIENTLLCPKCDVQAVTLDTQWGRKDECPKCDYKSWGGKPLTSSLTLIARRNAHAAFDVIWRDYKIYTRSAAYKMLAELMGMSKKKCHIGNMNESECRRVEIISQGLLNDYRPDKPMIDYYQHSSMPGLMHSIANSLDIACQHIELKSFVRDGLIESFVDGKILAFICVSTWMGRPQYERRLIQLGKSIADANVTYCAVKPYFDLHLNFGSDYGKQPCNSYGRPTEMLTHGSYRPYRQAKADGNLEKYIDYTSVTTQPKPYKQGIEHTVRKLEALHG